MSEAIKRAAAILAQAQRVLFITGAGVSADSGLPTYRGVGGLYQERHTDDAIPIEVALSGSMLVQRPQLTWKYLSEIEQACRGARPNAAHTLMAVLERHIPHVCVLTQNVDGLHRAAGSRNLIEMHGNIHHLYCEDCAASRWVADYSAIQQFPPPCTNCGGYLRPQVVLFGEALPQLELEHYYRELNSGFDAVFSVGTTSVFPYIAGPVVWAAEEGTPTVEINPGDTQVSSLVTVHVRSGAAAAMQALMQELGWSGGAE